MFCLYIAYSKTSLTLEIKLFINHQSLSWITHGFQGCQLLSKKGIKRAHKYIQTEEFSSFPQIGLYYKYFFKLHYCGLQQALCLAVFSIWRFWGVNDLTVSWLSITWRRVLLNSNNFKFLLGVNESHSSGRSYLSLV